MPCEFMKHVLEGTPPSRWFVLPTAAIRAFAIKHRQRLLPGCNYVLQWKDVNGFGLELAIADWAGKGTHWACGDRDPNKPYHFAIHQWSQQDIRAAAQQFGREWRTMLIEFEQDDEPNYDEPNYGGPSTNNSNELRGLP